MSTEPVTPNFLRDWPLPEPGAGKYGRGQVLIVGGAARTPGAAMLSALAALRVGAGRLTLAVGRSVANEVAVAVPESGVEPLDEDQDGHIAVGAIEGIADSASSADAVLVGPGLDEPDGSRDLVAGLADVVGPHTTVVLDAFALGVAADVRDRLEPLRGRLVMTPNSGEAERLLGRECSDDDVAVLVLVERFDTGLGHGDRDLVRDAPTDRERQPAGTDAEGGERREHRRSGGPRGAPDDEHLPAAVLPGAHLGQGPSAEEVRGDRFSGHVRRPSCRCAR